MLLSNESLNITIDGFTIQNGSGVHALCSGAGDLDLIITNNTITKNISDHNGAGIFIDTGSTDSSVTVNLTNNIIWGNKSLQETDIDLLISSGPGNIVVNAFYNNIENVQIDGGTYNDPVGHISKDPIFVDAGNSDYHLSYTSPLIDASSYPGSYHNDPKVRAAVQAAIRILFFEP
jgi:hypothetical protein